ncbi:hypothetical protein JCM10207_002323 [Rhodosporidiobolus poonsookiae]
MAMTQAKLPAPLRLNLRQSSSLSLSAAHAQLIAFLADDASQLLAGSGAVRASLVRLAQGIKDELDAAPVAAVEMTAPATDKKKRRKSEGGESKDKKKRKIAA